MSETTLPLVSVVTPAYNQAAYLVETIESVLAQDYPNIEHIVLNDGSKDDTEAILQGYTGRITWETHENMGEPRTVNKGYAMAKGDYVIAINADDPALPGMISKLVAYMETHPDVLAVYPNWVIMDEHSQIVDYFDTWEADYEKMVSSAVCVPGPGALIRRRGLEMVKGRDVKYRYVSDMDFWYRLGLCGPLAHLPEYLGVNRRHSEARGIAQKAEVGLEIITMIEDFFAQPDLPENIRVLHQAALGGAHFEAGIRMPTYPQMREYFLKSFRLHPRGWLDFKHRPPWVWAVLVTPEIISKLIYVIFNPRKYLEHKLGKSRPLH